MPGDLAVAVAVPDEEEVFSAPSFIAEWLHERVSDGVETSQNDYRVRIFRSSALEFQQVTGTQTRSPSVAANDDSNGGTVDWTHLDLPFTSNDLGAVADGSFGGGISKRLRLSAFGLDALLPADAAPQGIRVKVERRAAGTQTPEFIAASQRTSAAIAKTVPLAAQKNDLLIAHTSGFNDAGSLPQQTPPGWTPFLNRFDQLGDTTLILVAAWFWKIADENDAGKYYEFDNPANSANPYVEISVWRNVDVTKPIGGKTNKSTGNGTSSTIQLGGITVEKAGSLIVGHWMNRTSIGSTSAGTWSLQSGNPMTEDHDAWRSMFASVEASAPGTSIEYRANNTASDWLVAAVWEIRPGSLTDYEIRLALPGGDVSPTNLADTTLPWPSADTEKVYGTVSEKWGHSLPRSVVVDPEFGIVIAVNAPLATQAFVDHAQIEITYRYGDQLAVLTAPLYDSGQVASVTPEHSLPSNWGGRNNETYWFRVDVTDVDGLEGASDLIEFSTSWTPPPEIEGVTVTPVGGVAVVGG